MNETNECCGKDDKYEDGESCCKGEVKRRRQNTQYVDPESNWVTCCEFHFEIIEAHWADAWADYWSGCL